MSQACPRGTVQIRMVDDLRILFFNGNGLQDPEQHMFVFEAIWAAKQLQDQGA